MRRTLRGAVLLLLALFVLPAFAQDEKKDAKDEKKDVKDVKAEPKKDDKKDAKDEKKDAKDEKKDEKKEPKPEPKKEEKKDNGMVKVGQVVAQIASINEGGNALRLRVEVSKLNPQAVQALAQAQVQLQQAYLQPPQQRAQAIQQAQQKIAQQQASLYTKALEDVELSTTDDCVVRLKDPPPKFDDKGKLIRPTAKELTEMKGDSKLPGYKAEFSDLRPNQIVQVTLMRKGNLPKPKVNPMTKQIDPEALNELKPQISLIVVVAEPRQTGQ